MYKSYKISGLNAKKLFIWILTKMQWAILGGGCITLVVALLLLVCAVLCAMLDKI